VKRLLTLRREHPVFRRKRFLTGVDAAELCWFGCAGEPMTDEQWADPSMHAIAVYLDGSDAPDKADDGTPLLDDDFLILVNSYWDEVKFTIPSVRTAPQTWFVELDSYDSAVSAARVFPKHTGDSVAACPRSVQVLRAPRSES
jgi:isoamylase